MSHLIFQVLVFLPLLQCTAGGDPLTSWLTSASTRKPNVLFLVVDDLRPWLGCYGKSFMSTPNIDGLAKKSVRFDRAYVQQAICGPSRASFMTGRRPDTTHVFDLESYWRTVGGNFTTVSQYFKQHGYLAEGVGKIYHSGSSAGGTEDYPYSWSTKADRGKQTLDVPNSQASSVRPVAETGGKLQDTDIADLAITRLQNYASTPDQPFFLAVGFKKPHLPFLYPKQWDDVYANTNIPLAQHRGIPSSIPNYAWTAFPELRSYDDIANLNLSAPHYTIPDSYQNYLRKGYAAAVSYIDAQVGRVLTALSAAGFDSNTIVTFHSDHGFQLGENGQWTKHNMMETSTRVPMLVHVPTVTDVTQNSASARPVDIVSLFPTLTQLAGLPAPQTCPLDSSTIQTCVESASVVPLIGEAAGVSGWSNVPWVDVAFTQYPRHLKGKKPKMGYTIRTSDYRYTEWVAYNPTTYKADFTTVYATELYVHGPGSDPDPLEHYNKAGDSSYSQVKADLSQKLRAGWKGAVNKYLQQTGR